MSSYSSRTSTNPTSGNSDPLAEWSQKIKALQQETDADGQREQERLEQEIARSRMERARRRSTLTGNARVDQASASYLSRLPDDSSSGDRQQVQADALSRLTGVQRVATPPSSPPATSGANSKPVSLAEFMGGRATGPRLNKPAPQADFTEHAKDYEARRANGGTNLMQKIAQPSPVALHGLAKDAPSPSSVLQSERKQATPEPFKPEGSKPIPIRAETPPKPSTSVASQNLTRNVSTSTSSSNSSSRASTQPTFTSSPLGISTPGAKPSTPSTSVSPSNASSPPITARWTAAVGSPRSPPPSSPSPSNPHLKRLAGPVQPVASPVQHYVPPTNPSPAFLKPPPPKEERPSITRLKGRGFVESQVKASARLSSTQEESSKPQQTTGPERKLAVLNRWPAAQAAQSPTPTPEQPAPARREFTRSLPPTAVRPSDVAAGGGAFNAPKPAPRPRNLEHDSTPFRLPGMNGPSTPIKSTSMPQPRQNQKDVSATGIESTPMRLPGLAAEGAVPTALRKSSSGSNLRQHGRRRSVHFDDDEKPVVPNAAFLDGSQTDVDNAKKLTHLTKDRARKPRRAGAHPLSVQQNAEPEVEKVLQKEERPVKVQETKEEEIAALISPPEIATASIVFPVPTTKPQIGAAPVSNEPLVVAEPPKTPISPTFTRRTSGEKAKLPPPIIAPKPAALRRNSLPSPAVEKTSPILTRHTPSERLVGSNSDASPATGARTSSPTGPTKNEEPEVSPTINVKAAISAWGKQTQETKRPDMSRSKSNENVVGPASDESFRSVEKETETVSHSRESSTEPPIVVPSVLNPPTIPMPQPRPRPPQHSPEERRRSITMRYSSIMLPPLKEEKTPAATPEGSLKVVPATTHGVPSARDLHTSLAAISPEPGPKKEENTKAGSNTEEKEVPVSNSLTVDTEVKRANGHSPVSPMDRIVSIPHDDPPIPAFNLSRLLSSIPATPKIQPGNVISVEAFTISGSAQTAIKGDLHIFYEGEIISIVYRGKNKSTGLVSTTVWAWIGSGSSLGEKEEAKLQDMSSRFNTSLIKVPQGKEPFEMVQILGGTIAIRHGTRAHWSPENTALHCVRAHGSHFIVIEEVELMSRNVCSAFTYCLSILESLFIWYGCGSIEAERQAAASYAKSIAAEGVTPIELEEGTEDEMFWLMFDEGDYANANFWKFRAQSPIFAPRLWAVADGALQPVVPFCALDLVEDKVFMYDGVFELFVIVGEQARARRNDIRLALAAADSVAAASALTRTFPPPVHALVFPSRVPIDLRANFRLMNRHEGDKPLPEHINLLTSAEAQTQLNQTEWKLRDLKDSSFLPLAISPSMHPEYTS